MKKIFALCVVALFFAACPAQHEVTQIGNPNLDETQDVTQVTNPPGPLTETEDVTQVGSPTTRPGGTEEVTQIGSPTTHPDGGGEVVSGGEWTKPKFGDVVAKFPWWSSLNCKVVFTEDRRVEIITPGCMSLASPYKVREDGSTIESEPDRKSGCRIKGSIDEETGEARIDVVRSDGTVICSMMPPDMQEKLKGTQHLPKGVLDKKNLPKQ
jgi:hypothetical protein